MNDDSAKGLFVAGAIAHGRAQTSGLRVTRGNVSPEDKVRLIRGTAFDDARGSLVPFEFDQLPFMPRRMFLVRDVPVGTIRGGHAHRRQRQLLIGVAGKIVVDVSCEGHRRSFVLDRPQTGLLIEPGVWSSQQFAADGSTLLVLASGNYDPRDYENEGP